MSQAVQLQRVADVIVPAILEFKNAVGVGIHFHCEQLRTFVIGKHPHLAPDSPGRVLRAMRKRGEVNYRVVSRGQSLYEFLDDGEGR